MSKLAEQQLMQRLHGPYNLTYWNARVAGNGHGVIVLGLKNGKTLAVISSDRMCDTIRQCLVSRPQSVPSDESLVFWYIEIYQRASVEPWAAAFREDLKPREQAWPLVPAPRRRFHISPFLWAWILLSLLILLMIVSYPMSVHRVYTLMLPSFRDVLVASLIVMGIAVALGVLFVVFTYKHHPPLKGK